VSAAGDLLGFLASGLWLLLPVNAALSVWRRRRNRPGSSCWFAHAVIVAWLLSVIGLVELFLAGPLEGIGGPSEAQGELYSLEITAVLAPLNWALIALGGALPADRDVIQ
jgi:hypothetical protein